MRLKSIFSVQNIASVSFIKVCSSTRLSSQTKGGLTCEIVAAEIGLLDDDSSLCPSWTSSIGLYLHQVSALSDLGKVDFLKRVW